MQHRALLVATATLLATCAKGTPVPGERFVVDNPFRYDVPTPPTATYLMADTMTVVMSMPNGETETATSSASTIELTFEAHSGGVLATGTVSDYSASISSPLMPNMNLGGDGLSGDLEFVIGPLGDVEVFLMPEISGGGAIPAMPFQFNAQELFPRFPGHSLEPGDIWADTVARSVEASAAGAPLPRTGGGGSLSTVYTYTLTGDTVVDGRTLQKITVSGVGVMQATGAEVGDQMPGDMATTVEGFFLWDTGRWVVAAELVRTMDGSVSVMGMLIPMTMAGPLRLRLVK